MKINVKTTMYKGFNGLAHDWYQWRVFDNAIMNLRVL